MTDNDCDRFLQAVDMAVRMNENNELGLLIPSYQDENISIKVVKLIQSYTNIVNTTVWKKREMGEILK